MLETILKTSISRRWLVIFAVLAVCVLGVWNYFRLPIDAVPDITNVQVQINTAAEGYSPLEIEQRITFPVETALSGLPGLSYTRSLSAYGLSQVTVVFDEGTDLYFARTLVNERLGRIKSELPSGLEPEMGPIATGLGEIFTYSVTAEEGARQPDGSPYDEVALREIQDWIIKRQLILVDGVTEVNTIGGYDRQYHVRPDPVKLLSWNISMQQVVSALENNNSNRGAGYIESNGQQLLVRSPGQLQNIEDIENVVLATFDGIPVRVRDVATVAIGRELRTGAATRDGRETVLGTTFMLAGENSRVVAKRTAEKLVEINRTLPQGVIAEPVYDRTTLVDKAIATVQKNLLEGALLVILVLFLFVVMMLDINVEEMREGFTRYVWLGVAVALGVVAEVAYVLLRRSEGEQFVSVPESFPADYSNATELGAVLYTEHIYAFEIAGMILLVAIIAAITLTMRKRPGLKVQDIAAQVAVRREDRVRLEKVEATRE
jgi:cobalt-zinc-cadmium resistance protein CzcA